MDLSTLSVAQLRDLQQQIPAEIKRREAQEKINILNEVRAFAKARGYAIEDLLGKEVKPLDAVEKPKQIAIIDENTCIGCTLCIQACPVDAIVGAAKQMHTIISQQCTGCELCLPPCPVECIRMEAIPETLDNWKWKYPVIQIQAKAMSAASPLKDGADGIKEAV